jgi:hypothetical protein
VEDWLKPENVKAITQLVLPGFVIVYVRGRILPVRRVELKDAILGYLALSFFYQALLAPFRATFSVINNTPSPFGQWLFTHLYWLYSRQLAEIGLSFTLIVASLLIPAAIGLLLGLDAQRGWTRDALKKRGVNLSHPIDAAWDWRLGQEECWVHVKLKDGTKWAGHLGQGSFSSTDPTERDLYIEDVYDTGENDANWTLRGTGLWIAHGEIQSIEFWPEHREQVGDEQGDGEGTADRRGPAADAGEAAGQISAPSGESTASEPSTGRQEIAITLELKGIAAVEAPKRD